MSVQSSPKRRPGHVSKPRARAVALELHRETDAGVKEIKPTAPITAASTATGSGAIRFRASRVLSALAQAVSKKSKLGGGSRGGRKAR